MKSHRLNEIEEAFEWDDDYDIVLALNRLIYEKYGESFVITDRTNKIVLTEGEKVAIYVNWFDAEVANGGFHQFFTNSCGDKSLEFLHILKTIGSESTLKIFRKALMVFPHGKPSEKQSEREHQLDESGEEGSKILDVLDQEYFAQKENIFSLAAQHLQGCKPDFL